MSKSAVDLNKKVIDIKRTNECLITKSESLEKELQESQERVKDLLKKNTVLDSKL